MAMPNSVVESGASESIPARIFMKFVRDSSVTVNVTMQQFGL